MAGAVAAGAFGATFKVAGVGKGMGWGIAGEVVLRVFSSYLTR